MNRTTKRPKPRTPYHDRQLADGRVLFQTYLDRSLRERLDLLARKRDLPIWHLVNEMVEDFCDREEKAEADALRALFAAEGLVRTSAVAS